MEILPHPPDKLAFRQAMEKHNVHSSNAQECPIKASCIEMTDAAKIKSSDSNMESCRKPLKRNLISQDKGEESSKRNVRRRRRRGNMDGSERIQTACEAVSRSIHGTSCAFYSDPNTCTVMWWVSLDLVNTFGISMLDLQRLGLYLGASSVTFQFDFENANVSRRNVHFKRILPKFPATQEQIHTAFKESIGNAPSCTTSSLQWFLYDRIENKFALLAGEETTIEELFCEIIEFVVALLANAFSHCLICDKKLPICMPRPTACSHPSCLFQSKEIGLGFSVEEEIIKRPNVVELLITFFSCSLLSRREIDLQNIPRSLIEGTAELATTAAQSADSDELTPNELSLFFAFGQLPSIAEMVQLVHTGRLKYHLDMIDLRLYPLIRWLIGGCRSSIRLLEPSRQFLDMHTPYQFVVEYSSPEREAPFQRLRRESGSFFAFHGSSSFAWNSILSDGLKNLSNTSNMSYGALKGPGVYLSTSFHTCLHYSKPTKLAQPWVKSGLGCRPRAVALCEVIDRPTDFTFSDKRCFTECTPQERANGQLHVVPNEDFIHTRYIFVYSEDITPPPATFHIFALKAGVAQKLNAMSIQQQQEAMSLHKKEASDGDSTAEAKGGDPLHSDSIAPPSSFRPNGDPACLTPHLTSDPALLPGHSIPLECVTISSPCSELRFPLRRMVSEGKQTTMTHDCTMARMVPQQLACSIVPKVTRSALKSPQMSFTALRQISLHDKGPGKDERLGEIQRHLRGYLAMR